MLFKGQLYFYPCLPLLPWIKLPFAHQEDYRSLVYLIPRIPFNVCFLQLARVIFFKMYFQSCSLPISPSNYSQHQFLNSSGCPYSQKRVHRLSTFAASSCPDLQVSGLPFSFSCSHHSPFFCSDLLAPTIFLVGTAFFPSPCSLILLTPQGSFSTSIPQGDIPNLPLIHLQRPVLCQHPSQL